MFRVPLREPRRGSSKGTLKKKKTSKGNLYPGSPGKTIARIAGWHALPGPASVTTGPRLAFEGFGRGRAGGGGLFKDVYIYIYIDI